MLPIVSKNTNYFVWRNIKLIKCINVHISKICNINIEESESARATTVKCFRIQKRF